MQKSRLNLLGMLALAIFLFSSCSKEDGDGTPTQEETTDGYAVWLITNSSDFSGMLLTSDTLFSGEIDPAEASYKSLGYARNAGTSFGGNIYNVYNTSGDPGLQKYSYADNALSDEGFISVGESMFMYEVISETKGYYTDSDRSRTAIQTFNPSSMARTGDIDISDAMAPYITDSIALTRIGSFMMANGAYVYTQVFFLGADGYHYYDSTFVAVIDTATDELVNLAIYPDYIYCGYERKNTNMVNVGDDGYLYMASLVGNTNERQHSRCIRIAEGASVFDDWILDCNEIIDDEGSFTLGGPAVLNGKMYMRIKETPMLADWSNMSDEDLYLYEIDIATKEATKISGVPASVASVLYSTNGPCIIDDLVYIVVSNTTYQGYYAYDPTTGSASEVFSLTGGIPSQFIKIE